MNPNSNKIMNFELHIIENHVGVISIYITVSILTVGASVAYNI